MQASFIYFMKTGRRGWLPFFARAVVVQQSSLVFCIMIVQAGEYGVTLMVL